MLVYSVASKQSFEMVKIIRDKVLNHLVRSARNPPLYTPCRLTDAKGADWVPIVVVGNKSDLHIQRQVTAEEGKALTTEWNCAWTEASARHNENVVKAFELMIAEVEKAQNPQVPTGGSKCHIM